MSDYYDNAHRVVRDGVPCRVFQKGKAPGSKEIEIAAKAGVGLELGDVPGFSFKPDLDRHEELARATAHRAPTVAPKASKFMRDHYYKGRKRIMAGGVPCRVERVGTDRRHMHQWADLRGPIEPFEGAYKKRLEAFRDELEAKGSYEAAGVRPPEPMKLAA